MGEQGYGIDPATIIRIAEEIKDVLRPGRRGGYSRGRGQHLSRYCRAFGSRHGPRGGRLTWGCLRLSLMRSRCRDSLEKLHVLFTRVMTAIEMRRGSRALHTPPRHPPRGEGARRNIRRRHR